MDIVTFLNLLGEKVRHFFMRLLGVYDEMHNPDEWYGYGCCF